MNRDHLPQGPGDLLGGFAQRHFHRHANGFREIFERDDNLGDDCSLVVAFGDVEEETRVLTNYLYAPDAFAKHILHWHRFDKNRIAHDVYPRPKYGMVPSSRRQLCTRKRNRFRGAKPTSLTLSHCGAHGSASQTCISSDCLTRNRTRAPTARGKAIDARTMRWVEQ